MQKSSRTQQASALLHTVGVSRYNSAPKPRFLLAQVNLNSEQQRNFTLYFQAQCSLGANQSNSPAMTRMVARLEIGYSKCGRLTEVATQALAAIAVGCSCP